MLIAASAEVNAKAKDGSTPLHMAVKQKDIAQMLLRYGADTEPVDTEGRTSLYQALAHGSTEVADLLIDKGVKIKTAAKNGRTPLHMAVKQKGTVQRLLLMGVDKEAIDIEGRTPLYLALADGMIEVATLLLDEGANVTTAAKDGRTPLHMALSQGQGGLDIAKRLLRPGPNVNPDIYANAKAEDGATPLHIAAEYGPIEAIEMLFKLEANINAADAYGQTSLLIAIYEEKWDIAKSLLDYGADVKADKRVGYTPLLGAVIGGEKNIVQQLLKSGVDVDAADEDGYSPIHLAASQCNLNILSQLLRAGANINAVSKLHNQTSLNIAVRKSHREIVRTLLECGANTELLNSLDLSPLQYAVYRGDLGIVQEFVEHDKMSNTKAVLQKGKDGNTPMHTLCQWTLRASDEQTMCQMLDELSSISSKVDINARNDENLTPLDLAVSRAGGYRGFIDKLVKMGARSSSWIQKEIFEDWKEMKTTEEPSEA